MPTLLEILLSTERLRACDAIVRVLSTEYPGKREGARALQIGARAGETGISPNRRRISNGS